MCLLTWCLYRSSLLLKLLPHVLQEKCFVSWVHLQCSFSRLCEVKHHLHSSHWCTFSGWSFEWLINIDNSWNVRGHLPQGNDWLSLPLMGFLPWSFSWCLSRLLKSLPRNGHLLHLYLSCSQWSDLMCWNICSILCRNTLQFLILQLNLGKPWESFRWLSLSNSVTNLLLQSGHGTVLCLPFTCAFNSDASWNLASQYLHSCGRSSGSMSWVASGVGAGFGCLLWCLSLCFSRFCSSRR